MSSVYRRCRGHGGGQIANLTIEARELSNAIVVGDDMTRFIALEYFEVLSERGP
jgi:hypothetical protein